MLITESGDIMEKLINKYLKKLESQKLSTRDKTMLLALDADLYSNMPLDEERVKILKDVFALMNINTILFAEPNEPYRSIIDEIIRYDDMCEREKKIVPMDCETRTFFHDIPVIDDLSAQEIAKALSHRKSAIIKNKGIVAYGSVTPEQAFVSFSSTCFSMFVKYFYDAILTLEENKAVRYNEVYIERFKNIRQYIKPLRGSRKLVTEKPENEEDVFKMLFEAGRAVVECDLVDSYFGNISFVYNNKIFISQTGSSLDELEGCIDAVPMDGSSSVGITASSELSAHKNIYAETGDNAILHGHPKFSVVMSMRCENRDCSHYRNRDMCHKGCVRKRDIEGIPIVSGEIGTGPTGLVNTVPPAMRHGRGVIVYGHGVFTSGRDCFQKPFQMLMDIENICREQYLRLTSSFLEA